MLLRPWQIWLAFGLCVAAALAAVGWLSAGALKLDRAERQARRQAALEEKTRLALWRMDSTVSQLIIRENARPRAFYVSLRRAGQKGASRAAPHVLFHFQWDGAEALRLAPSADAAARGDLLDLLQRAETRRRLAALPESETPAPVVMPELPDFAASPQKQQRALSRQEFQVRAQIVGNQAVFQQVAAPFADSLSGALTPLWLDGRLLLARKAPGSPRAALEGCVLDWPSLRGELLRVVGDLLPAARLEPLAAAASESPHRLALLPVRLGPGAPPDPPPAAWSPIRRALAVAWGVLALVILAAALVLRSVLALSERRAAFVSAVTHELRTPLTTFRLYCDMLAEGALAEPRRAEYLKTLQSEAERLTHLVENVLTYARLERRPAAPAGAPLSGAALLDRIAPRLRERAARSGLQLEIESQPDALACHMRADADSVERILANLVDNAGKYAASADDRRLHLEIAREGGRVALALRDHGPGVARGARRRLFRPFHRSAGEAAKSAPGVGLGLALSRRLARALGGDLRLDRAAPPGAKFVLLLPIEGR